jgi:hypothetical protein
MSNAGPCRIVCRSVVVTVFRVIVFGMIKLSMRERNRAGFNVSKHRVQRVPYRKETRAR